MAGCPRGREEPVTESLDGPGRTVRAVRIVAVRGADAQVRQDRIVGEEPMEIRAVGPGGGPPVSVAITMRTPGHDAELAVGFLITEGLVRPRDVDRTTIGDPTTISQPENEITVHLARNLDPATLPARNFVATASCGICGKASLDQVAVRCDPLQPGPVVTPAALAGELPLRDRVLLVSGRVSFEIVQKAAVAGIPIVAAISAPTDLAVDAARRLSMTLVGFLRGDGFNVYTGEERVQLG